MALAKNETISKNETEYEKDSIDCNVYVLYADGIGTDQVDESLGTRREHRSRSLVEQRTKGLLSSPDPQGREQSAGSGMEIVSAICWIVGLLSHECAKRKGEIQGEGRLEHVPHAHNRRLWR